MKESEIMKRILNVRVIILFLCVIALVVLLLLAKYLDKSNNTEFREETMLNRLQDISMQENSEAEMYNSYIKELCESDLWKERDAYDSCTYLMVPMWYAFQTENDHYVNLFTEYVERFTEMYKNRSFEFEDVSSVNRNQHLYFLSEYMSLCRTYGYEVPKELFNILYKEMESYINTYTGSYENDQGYQNMWEVLDGLLDGKGYGLGMSYDHILTDNDMYPLAILCDLLYISDEVNKEEIDGFLNMKNAAEYANRVMKEKVTSYEDGTWLFQIGEAKDSPGYEYAGIDNIDAIEEGQTYKVENITSDTSHYARMPLWLRSFRRAQSRIEEGIPEYYDSLIEGLGNTVIKNMLVKPDETCEYYRLNNYSNGVNGLYRYGYHEDEVGYGPYGVSSTFLLGWYSFCGKEEISKAYAYTAEKFPLDEKGKRNLYRSCHSQRTESYFLNG